MTTTTENAAAPIEAEPRIDTSVSQKQVDDDATDFSEISNEITNISSEKRVTDRQGGDTLESVEPAQSSDADPASVRADDEFVILGDSANTTQPDITAESLGGPIHDNDLIYNLKWINFYGERRPIVIQNQNGPCPLISLANVLLLRGVTHTPAHLPIISTSQLIDLLANCIFDQTPPAESGADWQQNQSDAIQDLHRLTNGLDVNVRFTGVSDFEFSAGCLPFDLLGVPLLHGWLVERADHADVIGQSTYNQLVERLVDSPHSHDSLLVEDFLSGSASQLTYRGLTELHEQLAEGRLAVFFRNNHFSTVHKHKGQLWTLMTDQGYLDKPSVVWESLSDIDGNTNFVDSDFQPASGLETDAAAAGAAAAGEESADLLLARQLQEREDLRTAEEISRLEGEIHELQRARLQAADQQHVGGDGGSRQQQQPGAAVSGGGAAGGGGGGARVRTSQSTAGALSTNNSGGGGGGQRGDGGCEIL